MYCMNTILCATYVNTPVASICDDQNVTIIRCMVTYFHICPGQFPQVTQSELDPIRERPRPFSSSDHTHKG